MRPALPFAVAPGTTAVAGIAFPGLFQPALVVATRGSVATTLSGERGLAPLGVTAVPQLLDPSAVTAVFAGEDAQLPAIAVADRATDSVLVLAGKADGTFAVRQAIPVGRAPAALARTNKGLLVADAGSNDVRLLASDDAGVYRQAQVFEVAAEPVALATGSFGRASATMSRSRRPVRTLSRCSFVTSAARSYDASMFPWDGGQSPSRSRARGP